MIAGLLTIWWYCTERHLSLFDELPGDYDDDSWSGRDDEEKTLVSSDDDLSD